MHKYRTILLIVSLTALFCISEAQECNLGHTKSGTAYGEFGVKQYASIKHGPDGSMFLDPYFLPFIENVRNQVILDAGCGAAPWAIYAAQHGAQVYGIDIQPSMIEKGNEDIIKLNLEDRIVLEVGTVSRLPYKDASFDKAISINVGCNLPSTNLADQEFEMTGLSVHLTELARVLKEKGKVIITAPASFDIVFTSGRRELSEIMKDIKYALNQIDGENPASIVQYLALLIDVYRATFVSENGKLKLVTTIDDLSQGQKIWRKLPGLVVPNVYHSENEYINEAINAGFNIVKIEKPKFNNKAALIEYNQQNSEDAQLGDAYIGHNPFIIFELEKP